MRHANWTVWALECAGVLLASAALLAGGCDLRPAGPITASGEKIRSMAVNPADPAEAEVASNMRQAEAAYDHALNVLRAHYLKAGIYAKREWAQRELKNLQRARTWQIEGLDPLPQPGSGSIEQAEALLAERVVDARQQWKEALGELDDYYAGREMNFKLAMVRTVQRRFDHVHEYAYFLHAEVPPPDLRPREFVQAANDLYDRALTLHHRGKPFPAITDYGKQRKALGLFLEMVHKYPTSTKIARSAYYIGEIYKEYFNENLRAVQWYERAWRWDSNIPLPARSQAAFVYDFRLHRRAKALDLYRQVIEREQFAPDRVRYSRQRIGELENKAR